MASVLVKLTTSSFDALAEGESVHGDGSDHQGRRQPGEQQRGQIDPSLKVAGRGEPGLERNAQQKGEEDLYARPDHTKLLEEFGPVAIQPMSCGLLPRVVTWAVIGPRRFIGIPTVPPGGILPIRGRS
jgi:hypothetical protein